MLNIFTDNWDNLPVLDDHERMLRIITSNPMNELYVIVDDVVDDEELEEELRWSLSRQYGRRGQRMYKSYEDVSDLYR